MRLTARRNLLLLPFKISHFIMNLMLISIMA